MGKHKHKFRLVIRMEDPIAKRRYIRTYGQNPIILAKCKCGKELDSKSIERWMNNE